MWNILLVDDEAVERDGMQFLIGKNGLPLIVWEASNGKQAFETIKHNKIDILLTDIKMPYMDGLELALATYEYDPEIQIILFSAYSDFDYAKKALQAQAVNYLLKPIELDEFSHVMKEVIINCEKKNAQKEQARNLREAGKKDLLHQLFTGKAGPKLLSGLACHDIHLTGQHMILADVETRDSFFDEWESLFLELLSRYSPYSHIYFNLYPNESYVLFFSGESIEQSRIEQMYRKLNQCLQKETGGGCSFLGSGQIIEIGQLIAEISQINKIKKEIYECLPGMNWVSGYGRVDCIAGEVEKIRSCLNTAISMKNTKDIGYYVEALVKAVASSKSVSVIYMHHVFYDLIRKLYLEFGICDSELIQGRISRVVSCRDYLQLSETFRDMLDEIIQAERSQEEQVAQAVRQVIRIIQQEYTRDLSLDYLAQKVHFTSSYLSYVFKKETGDNLVKYITDYRMGRARLLLEDSSQKILQVAKQCGYDNQSYFNRLFKNYYGVTPTQYKEKINV